MLTELIEYLSIEQTIEYSWSMWKGKANKWEGSFLIQIAELEELLEALTRVVGLYDLLENARTRVRQDPRMPEPVWHDLDALRKFVDTCKLVIKKSNLESVQQELSESISGIREFLHHKSCHPLAQKALNSMRSRDMESYEAIVRRLVDLQQLSKRLTWTESLLDSLRSVAPVFANELKKSCQDEKWINRMHSIEKAWNWARAHSWLRDFLNAEDTSSLERRAKQLEKEEKDTLANLAEIQAWKFCFMRLQEEHRRHLVGWQQAIRKIGKGTGKSAPKHRRNAQQHFNKCREAVPAWVMPLHRLWDTVDPSPGMFDVIIVDEASQCGPDSLPLMYLGKKLLVVGDDKQISPEVVGIDESARQQLIQEHLHGFEHADSFDMEGSLFAHGRRRFGNRIVLREHFRCMPEIIRFSNDLCYHDTPLIPLRRYPPERLEPLNVIHVPNGYREGDGAKAINRPEAEALVKRIAQCCQDDRYNDKTMGVIILQGQAQAQLIESMLVKELGAEEMEKRGLICGNPYAFQGDEREIIFLSMVAAPNQRIGAFTKATDERRFNVAASRAKDQMWLFHTATRNDLSDTCLRKRLLEFFDNPQSQITQALGEEAEQLSKRAHSANRRIEQPPSPYDSWFELDVCLAIAARGYRVVPQYPIAGKFIDLVVEGKESQLAVECDGDHWHGADRYQEDMERQRKLERAGWQFYRIRESSFYANREKDLEGLWMKLRELNIFPVSSSGEAPDETHKHKEKLPNEIPVDKLTYTHSVTKPTVEAKTHEEHPVESRSLQEEVLDPVPSPQDEEIENPASAEILSLTARQKEILRLVAQGYTNREIGEQLDISVRTVEVHRFNLMRRLRVRNVAQLLRQVTGPTIKGEAHDQHPGESRSLHEKVLDLAPSPQDEEIENPDSAPTLLDQVIDEEIEFDGYQAPYANWNQTDLPDPRSVTLDKIISGLLAIISVEGPIVCHRAYFLYASTVKPPIMRVGGQIRSTFDKAISQALQQGLIEGRDEHENRELYCRVVRKVGTPAAVVRKRGKRDFDEIPPSELKTLMNYLDRQNPGQYIDQLFQSVIERYDFGQMTSNMREKLLMVKLKDFR